MPTMLEVQINVTFYVGNIDTCISLIIDLKKHFEWLVNHTSGSENFYYPLFFFTSKHIFPGTDEPARINLGSLGWHEYIERYFFMPLIAQTTLTYNEHQT